MSETIDLDAERYLRDPVLQATIAHLSPGNHDLVEVLIRYAYQQGRLDGGIAAIQEATNRLDALIND